MRFSHKLIHCFWPLWMICSHWIRQNPSKPWNISLAATPKDSRGKNPTTLNTNQVSILLGIAINLQLMVEPAPIFATDMPWPQRSSRRRSMTHHPPGAPRCSLGGADQGQRRRIFMAIFMGELWRYGDIIGWDLMVKWYVYPCISNLKMIWFGGKLGM